VFWLPVGERDIPFS